MVLPLVLSLMAGVCVGVIAMVMLIASEGSQIMLDSDILAERIQRWIMQPPGFLLAVIANQLAFACLALGAAWWSPVPMRQRLGLLRPGLRWWAWPALMLGTLFLSFWRDLLSMLVGVEIDSGQMPFAEVFTTAKGPMLWLLAAVIGLLPGVFEEMLFRGYVQKRLLQAWPAAGAIAFSTAAFAIAHVHPLHVIAVIPLGAWFGVIAWRTGSILPAMACHIFNNVMAVLLNAYLLGGESDAVGGFGMILMMSVSAAAFFIGVIVLAAGAKAEKRSSDAHESNVC